MTENATTDQQTDRQKRQNTMMGPFMILQKHEIMIGFPGAQVRGQAGGLYEHGLAIPTHHETLELFFLVLVNETTKTTFLVCSTISFDLLLP